MSYIAPDLSSILTNEQELNNRLTALKTILQNQWTAIGSTYSDSYSINKLITDMSNPPAFVVKRNSDYYSGQLGNIVNVYGNIKYTGWNGYNPTSYSDTDYWYLQSLTGSSNATVTAWGGFNTGNVDPTDKFNMIMYGRGMDSFNNGAFSGVGFTYQTPTEANPISGFFIGITLDSGTYYPAYAIFNNSSTPMIVKMDYGTYPSASTEFRLLLQNNPEYGGLNLYWYKENTGKFLWNYYIDYSSLPSGFSQTENLVFGNVCYGTGLGRMSYIPRLYYASPCRFNIL